METLKKDGLCSDKMTFHDFIVETRNENIMTLEPKNHTLYERNIAGIIEDKLGEEFCRMTVKGVEFPIVLSNENIEDISKLMELNKNIVK
jgi:hypothetical protein